MARPGSKAAKKRDPRRPDEWSAERYPYRIDKQYGDPVYKGSIKEVKTWLSKDLNAFRKQFEFLGDVEVVKCCDVLLQEVSRLDEGFEHAVRIAGIIDPRTRLRYEATVTRRKRP